MLVCYLYVWQCLHHKTTKEQVKTCLASTVQVGVQPVSSLAALEVLIREATVSVANSYNVVLLQQNLQFFGGAEGGELFSCPPQTGSFRYLLISLQLLVLLITTVTRPL